MVVDVIHPGRANVAKSELSDLLAGMYKADAKLTVTFGFKTKFGDLQALISKERKQMKS